MTPVRLLQLIRKAFTHLRQGTLLDAIRRRRGTPRAFEPSAPPLNRFSAQTPSQAAQVLAKLLAAHRTAAVANVILVGDDSNYRAELLERLDALGVVPQIWSVAELMQLERFEGPVAAIGLAALDSRTQFAVVRHLVARPALSEVPFEYIALPRTENETVSRWDAYRNEDFVSPMLSKYGDRWFAIYEQALQRFEFKTDVRDFLDVAQLLKSVVERGIPGNVAEFGSFRGHSGYLMSRLLDEFNSDKVLFMFDMFEKFPDEGVGVDRFWSGTHPVDFAEVQRKFTDRPNVRLVKGDFTRTLGETSTGALAFAFIDCDSYRATGALLREIWADRLSEGGIVALEDYGHAALLGNRVAVHEFFDGRTDAFTYFSPFSGFFIAVRLPGR